MAGSTAEWERYGRWNDAIAAVVYPRQENAVPVYLDLEDDVLAEIQNAAEPDATDAAAALIEAVKGTLVFADGPATLFRGHLNRLARWRSTDGLSPPPTLGLLALLSLAAERMHEGEGKAAHNFYGRLADLLQLDATEIDWFTTGYLRKHNGVPLSQMFWSSLNDWLELLEGNRGIPTAYAVGHAHIGLPLSQALVREGDRAKFGDMFASYGLPPRSSYPAAEMGELISEWVSRVPCPVSKTLAAIWKRSAEARERIIDVARLTLESWDGAVTSEQLAGSGTAPLVDAVRARATLRTFPKRQLDITLIVPARVEAANETVELLDDHEDVVATIDLVPAASGWLTVADPEDLDVASFLDGVTALRRAGQTAPLRRRARRLVPMRWDDMLQGFVECERVQLGEDCLLVVRNDIADRADEMLTLIARPGWVREQSLAGVPAGWTGFHGVQILSAVPADLLKNTLVDLNLLQPSAATQVVLQGGMKLPGNLAKWSTALPPEVRASTDSGETLWASIRCVRPLASPEPEPREREVSEPVLVWDVGTEHLPDGDYEVIVLEADGGQLASPLLLRLRSADHPAVLIDPSQLPIAHDIESELFGLVARRADAADAFILAPSDGVDVAATQPPPEIPVWYVGRLEAPKRAAKVPRVVVPHGDESSCMTTGQHYMLIDQYQKGMQSLQGVCRYCGLTKRYPVKLRKNTGSKARKAGTKAAAPNVNVAVLDPVKERVSVDWGAGFDALCHVGSGPMSWLERIAMQIDATGLFVDTFARRLEMMGHIEIERDPRNLKERSWDLVDPTFFGLANGDLGLVGFRSEHLMTSVEDAVWRAGGSLANDGDVESPAVVRISGLDDDGIASVVNAAKETTRRSVRLVADAAWALASVLKPLSCVLAGLPVITTIGARGYERWNTATARFDEIDAASQAGAYRITSFQRTYIYRRPEDLGEMQALLGDARIVKYAAALHDGVEMLGYDANERVLYTPLGADLPGLYGRAIVLASGYAPVGNEKERLLEYRDVPPNLAGHIASLLMS